MRHLIVSDIHANWEALEAVLADASGDYEQVVCLGDLVGYGPDPNRVVEWVRANVLAVVRGNHDRASTGLDSLEWFNPLARTAAVWTQQNLTPENQEYVRGLPKGPVHVDNYQIVHGSPFDEDGYIVSQTDASFAFPYLEFDLTFFGHTHLQGGFVWRRAVASPMTRPRVSEDRVTVQMDPDTFYLINPGSVGQPRDQDPRAGYVIYESGARWFEYRRVPYDIGRVQEKIRAAGLPDLLADRLALGR